MKRLLTVLLVSTLLTLFVVPGFAQPILLAEPIATPPNCANGCTGVADSITGAFGDCDTISTSGNIGAEIVSMNSNPLSVGTMFAAVYLATGTPGTSCTPNTTPLGISNRIDLGVLTVAFQTITFTFPNSQQAAVVAGQVVFVAVIQNFTSGSGTTDAQFTNNVPLPNVNRETCSGTSNWLAGALTGCGFQFQCTAGFQGLCNGFELDGVVGGNNGNGSPSPYGNNPILYPCCAPVTAQALQGASLRAPDVDSLPLIWLFILLLIVTLGSYVVVRSRQKRPAAKQYELGI
jgi:hypothetical protein